MVEEPLLHWTIARRMIRHGLLQTAVEIARIRLATDRFLQAASLNASADAGRQTVRYELYDRIQSMFGDPGGDTGFFSKIDDVFASFAATADARASALADDDRSLVWGGIHVQH